MGGLPPPIFDDLLKGATTFRCVGGGLGVGADPVDPAADVCCCKGGMPARPLFAINIVTTLYVPHPEDRIGSSHAQAVSLLTPFSTQEQSTGFEVTH